MTSPLAPLETASLAVELGKAWIGAYRDAPDDPISSDQFDQVQALMDQWMEQHEKLDPIVRQAYQWISAQDPPAAATDFMLSLMHQFENVTELGVEAPRVSALVAIPIIGTREHANRIAQQAMELGFEQVLCQTDIVPRGAKIKWLARPVSLAEAGEWMADHRRALQLAALEGGSLEKACPAPEDPYGIDRAELSMLMGVMIALEKDVDACMQEPAFLYSNPSDFLIDEDSTGPEDDRAFLRREQAFLIASDLMTQRLVDAGFEGSVMEKPGTMTEALATMVAWSLRLQMLSECQLMGVSEADLDHSLPGAMTDVAMDANADEVSLVLNAGGRLLGPFSTDLPWRSVPLPMLSDALMVHQLASSPQNIRWHETKDQLWRKVQSTQRKWRLN